MREKSIWVRRLTLAVGLAAAAGCGAADEVEDVQQPVLAGNWAFDLWDGATGPDPFRVDSPCPQGLCALPVCAALEAGRWHGGKLWEGSCRYEYGGDFHRRRTYAVLQLPSQGSYGFTANQGQGSPRNAIISPDGIHSGIPLCRAKPGQGAPLATGKAWPTGRDASCRVEFDNRIVNTQAFDYIVQE